MAEKKKVTIVTKKKKASGAADASSPKAGTKAGIKKAVPSKTMPSKKKKAGLLGGLPSLPDLLDFPAGVAETAREVWMAGIGALSTVEEVGGELFQSLVQKGEHWEEASRKKLTSASKTAGAAAGVAAGAAKATAESLGQKPLAWSAAVEAQVQRVVEDSVEGVLHRLNVPTHDEVQDLIARVAALAGKVDTLTRQRASAPAKPTPPPKPTPSAKPTPPPKAASNDAATASGTPVYHVVPHDEGWAVEKEGGSRALSVHGIKAEATTAGRERAKAGASGRLVLHRKDGTIQDTFSYGE